MSRRYRHFNVRDAGGFVLLDAKRIEGIGEGVGINRWNNWANFGLNATQSAVGAFKPTYRSRVQGGQAVARFDGIRQFMTISGSIVDNQPFVVTIAAQNNNIATSKVPTLYFDGIDTGSRVYVNTQISASDITIGMFAGTGSGIAGVSASRSDGNPFMILSYVVSGSNSTLSRNGYLWQTGTVGIAGLPRGMTICGDPTGSHLFWGDLAYISVAQKLNQSTQNRVEQSVAFSYKLLNYGNP